LLQRAFGLGGSQERRTDCSGDRTSRSFSAASKIAAFCFRCAVARRTSIGQGERTGFTGHRAARPDRSVDYRRYVFSQARLAFGWGAPSILRPAWQAGQLPGGSYIVDRQHDASLPIAYRLYLPQEWAEDAVRRKKARIPKAITFKTKPQIALEQIRNACAADVPRGVVLLDASYGSNSALRTGISALGLKYVAAIVATVKVRKASKRAEPEPRLSVKQL